MLKEVVLEMRDQMQQLGKQVKFLYNDQIYSIESSPKSSEEGDNLDRSPSSMMRKRKSNALMAFNRGLTLKGSVGNDSIVGNVSMRPPTNDEL